MVSVRNPVSTAWQVTGHTIKISGICSGRECARRSMGWERLVLMRKSHHQAKRLEPWFLPTIEQLTTHRAICLSRLARH